jgi:hypothetical protein
MTLTTAVCTADGPRLWLGTSTAEWTTLGDPDVEDLCVCVVVCPRHRLCDAKKYACAQASMLHVMSSRTEAEGRNMSRQVAGAMRE